MGPEDLEVMANAANADFTPTMAPPIPTTDLGHLPEMSMGDNAPNIADLAGGPTPMAERYSHNRYGGGFTARYGWYAGDGCGFSYRSNGGDAHGCHARYGQYAFK